MFTWCVEHDGGIGIFNFTVEGNHNYFILAKEYEYGQTCILVHNTSPKKMSPHAVQRAEEGRRTLTAFRDAAQAKTNDIYVQPDGRYYVTDPKARAHVFEPDGELVTTMERASAKSVRQKLMQGDMERATPEQITVFRGIFQ